LRGTYARAATAEEGFEIGASLTLPPLLHEFGMFGPAPLWLAVLPGTLFAVLSWPPSQRWLAGGDLADRVAMRTAMHLGALTGMIYISGWGPIVAFGYVSPAATHLRWSGSRSWPIVVGWTVLLGTTGQLLLAFGLVHSYVPAAQAQVAGVLGLLVASMIIRGIGIMVADRERAQAALGENERRFRALVYNASDVITVIDAKDRVSYLSPSVERVTGHCSESLIGHSWGQYVDPADQNAARALRAAVRTDPGAEHRGELRLRHSDDSYHWHEVVVRNLFDDPAVRGVVVNHRDISDRRAYHELLVYDASHDMLTGLPNRASLTRRLIAACTESRQGGPQVAMLLLDLDGFKEINDTLGHQAGDDVLVAVAGALTDSLLGSDMVGRLGGDEFAAVLTPIDYPADALAAANRILAALRQPITTSGRVVHTAASIGIALSAPDHPEAAELLRRADVAMYEAKRQGKDGVQVYAPDRIAGPTRP
jgi:diguanylate cyclase (GGDEF)-like protein/PAS domain S-box-containing protein